MGFPDHTPPQHPFGGGDGTGFWHSFLTGNEQPQRSDSTFQFDQHPFKGPRISENSQNFQPFQQTNPRVNPLNVPGSKGTSHIFYKTRTCAKFLEGTCRNGDHCSFAHGIEDLRKPPPNWQDLIREKADKGAVDAVGIGGWGDDQRGMIHRMKICKKYYNGEECPYGDKCNFLHERRHTHPQSKKLKIDASGQRDSAAISVGVTGDPRGSARDLDQTVYWKTKLCSKYEIGQCPYGDICHFAHGLSDLKFLSPSDEMELAAPSVGFPLVLALFQGSRVFLHSAQLLPMCWLVFLPMEIWRKRRHRQQNGRSPRRLIEFMQTGWMI